MHDTRSDDEFFARVRVEKGLRTLAEAGGLVGEDGTVTIYDEEEQVIATAPCGDVWAHQSELPGAPLQVWLDGTRYRIDDAPAPATSLLRMLPGVSKGFIGEFLEWFPTQCGNVGKPS